MSLRDRDAIVTREGLIFRVLGYSHPLEYYLCDAEYAPERIFSSSNPKALRNRAGKTWYKFFEDEAWKFLKLGFKQYLIFNDVIHRQVIGVNRKDVAELRKPEQKLRVLAAKEPHDDLLKATQDVVNVLAENVRLNLEGLGLFGSLLHDFYHPKYSDIDLIVYGNENNLRVSRVLKELYESSSPRFTNEFATVESVKGKPWHFRNISLKEYWWHQRRKLVYAIFDDVRSGRKIKTEFEPVKTWNEIRNDYDPDARIRKIGWTKILARVTSDTEAPFIPSIYGIEPKKVIEGPKEAAEITRIVSYVEEFRKQVMVDETVYVEGNLEEVTTVQACSYQIALTFCPRYYEQALKVVDQN